MNEAIARIRRAVTTDGLKKSALAAEAKIRAETLSGLEDPTWNPRVSTIRALTDALDRIAARLAA
jgi:predicted transcriptional regulator